MKPYMNSYLWNHLEVIAIVNLVGSLADWRKR